MTFFYKEFYLHMNKLVWSALPQKMSEGRKRGRNWGKLRQRWLLPVRGFVCSAKIKKNICFKDLHTSTPKPKQPGQHPLGIYVKSYRCCQKKGTVKNKWGSWHPYFHCLVPNTCSLWSSASSCHREQFSPQRTSWENNWQAKDICTSYTSGELMKWLYNTVKHHPHMS